MNKNSHPEIGGRSAKIALVLLVIVYVFNFIDRQILSVLAEDIKADLNITDSDLGFFIWYRLCSFLRNLWHTFGEACRCLVKKKAYQHWPCDLECDDCSFWHS